MYNVFNSATGEYENRVLQIVDKQTGEVWGIVTDYDKDSKSFTIIPEYSNTPVQISMSEFKENNLGVLHERADVLLDELSRVVEPNSKEGSYIHTSLALNNFIEYEGQEAFITEVQDKDGNSYFVKDLNKAIETGGTVGVKTYNPQTNTWDTQIVNISDLDESTANRRSFDDFADETYQTQRQITRQAEQTIENLSQTLQTNEETQQQDNGQQEEQTTEDNSDLIDNTLVAGNEYAKSYINNLKVGDKITIHTSENNNDDTVDELDGEQVTVVSFEQGYRNNIRSVTVQDADGHQYELPVISNITDFAFTYNGSETQETNNIAEEDTANENQQEENTNNNQVENTPKSEELSDELDENGIPFVKASDGTTIFGEITADKGGLAPAPIRLSAGNSNYGLKHIEQNHGQEIQDAGYNNVAEFVEDVAKNFDTIRIGNEYDTDKGTKPTYLIELTTKKNKTLFVELSKDGSYWNINSAGLFRQGYSKKKALVWTLPALSQNSTAENKGVAGSDISDKDSADSTSGNSPQTSASNGKGTTNSETTQETEEKTLQQSGIDNIRNIFESADRKEGFKGSKTLPNGEKVRGRYILVESTGITPSHDVMHNFVQTEGFPTREDGTTLNDRDYEKDKNAQAQVIQRATQYDGRAVTDMPIVDNNGIVLSGNDRTMSGQLSAMQEKDGAYLESLQENAQMYGFTEEDVRAMNHPRLVFMLDENMDYTTENFAKFNQNEKKTQNNIEKAVKVGKTIKPETIRQIAQVIDRYDSIAECLSDKKGVNDIITFLERDGQIQRNDVEQYLFNGTFNEAVKEYIQTVLIGATLNEESVRMINAMPFIKKNIVSALHQIFQNAKLGDYSLKQELDEAIKTVYQAHKQMGIKQGEDLKPFYTQLGIFGENNIKSKTVQMLAKILNSEKVRELKKVLSSYDDMAIDSANGQVDMFGEAGHIKTKEEILEEIINSIENNEQRNRTKQSGLSGNGNKTNTNRGRTDERKSEPDGRGSQTTSQTNSSTGNEKVKPIGTNKWGNVYQGEKGKAKEYAHLLEKEQGGYVKDVFSNKELGNIDLNWGNDKGGLKHIIDKHIKQRNDFATLDEAIDTIENVLANGEMTEQGTNRSFDYNGYRISVAQSNEGNWVITAFDKTRSKENKERKSDTTIGDQSTDKKENGTLVSPDLNSESKVTTNSETTQNSFQKTKTQNGTLKKQTGVLSASQKKAVKEKVDTYLQTVKEESPLRADVVERALNTTTTLTTDGKKKKLTRAEYIEYCINNGIEIPEGKFVAVVMDYYNWAKENNTQKTAQQTSQTQEKEIKDNTSEKPISKEERKKTEALSEIEEYTRLQKTAEEKRERQYTVIGEWLEINKDKYPILSQYIDKETGYIDTKRLGGVINEKATQKEYTKFQNDPEGIALNNNAREEYEKARQEAEDYEREHRDKWREVFPDNLYEIEDDYREKAGLNRVLPKKHKQTDNTQQTAEDKALLETVVDKLKETIGEDNVITDSEEAQRILDEANGKTSQDIEQINNQFNDELQQQIDGTLPKEHIYHLGKPSDILLSAGIPNLQVELKASRLSSKAKQVNHPFELEDVKNLVNALQNPVAVFEYGDKTKAQNIIVEISKNGKNFLVGLSLNPQNLQINDIRGIFPKDTSEWLNWIVQGKSLYLDKQKIQTLIDKQRINLAEVEYLDLDSVAKVLQNFENPRKTKINQQKIKDSFELTEAIKEITGAIGYVTNSAYIKGTAENGTTYEIRVGNHIANFDNFETHSENLSQKIVSIVILDEKFDKKNARFKSSEEINDYLDKQNVDCEFEQVVIDDVKNKTTEELQEAIDNIVFGTKVLKERGRLMFEDDKTNIRYHKVYHGSPHDFEAFDHSKMGTGEGSQAFGWGSYVTEVEGIGRAYASTNKRTTHKYDVTITNKNGTKTSFLYDDTKTERNLLEEVARLMLFTKDITTARQWTRDKITNAKSQKEKELQQKILDFLKEHQTKDFKISTQTTENNLYTVEVPDDNGKNYLYHDRADKQTNEKVKNALITKLLNTEEYRGHAKELQSELSAIDENTTGADLYGTVSAYLGGDKQASKFLNELGFVGISYPANATTGGRTDGARNYVIFNEKDLKITDHIKFFKTSDGQAYGFTANGKIYIDTSIAKADTPIHEYTHLWAEALKQNNPKEWKNVVDLMKKEKILWDKIKQDYPELKTDDEIAEEVLAHYSGENGLKRLNDEVNNIKANSKQSIFDKARMRSAVNNVKQALERFWKGVASFFNVHFTSAQDLADTILSDFLNGVNPIEETRKSKALRRQERKEKRKAKKKASWDKANEKQNIEEINNIFNHDLQELIDGRLNEGHIFNLGRPPIEWHNGKFSSDRPIIISKEVLYSKSIQENHPFDLKLMKDLPILIQNAMMLFNSERLPQRFIVVTDKRQDGKNFVVVIEKTKSAYKVNTIHPRNDGSFFKWIFDKQLRYVNKKAAIRWLNGRDTMPNAPVDQKSKIAANSVAKILQIFKNPTELRENSSKIKENKEYNAEQQEIINKAKADGTYMKAPNGKKTNLTERQWVQVRTKAFKDWFGDWEKSAKAKAIRGLKAITVIRNNFTKEEVKERYGKIGEVTNKNDNRKVTFYKGVFGKMYKDGGLFAQIVPQLKGLFENSVLAYSETDNLAGTTKADGTLHKEHRNISSYDNYVAKAKIDGKEYYVRFTVQNETDGRRGNHSLMVTNVSLYDNTVNVASASAKLGERLDIDSITDAKLQQFFENARQSEDNFSKVVDENGEPMVVYHTTSEQFTAFDREKARANSDVQAFFFSEGKADWADMGDNTMAVFLNMRNPSNKPIINQSENNGGIKAREELQRQGYDGTIEREDGAETEYSVFEPNQIKSATDNIGTFSRDNNDIRYHKAKPTDNNEFIDDNSTTKDFDERLMDALTLNFDKEDGEYQQYNRTTTKIANWLEEKFKPLRAIDKGHDSFAGIRLLEQRVRLAKFKKTKSYRETHESPYKALNKAITSAYGIKTSVRNIFIAKNMKAIDNVVGKTIEIDGEEVDITRKLVAEYQVIKAMADRTAKIIEDRYGRFKELSAKQLSAQQGGEELSIKEQKELDKILSDMGENFGQDFKAIYDKISNEEVVERFEKMKDKFKADTDNGISDGMELQLMDAIKLRMACEIYRDEFIYNTEKNGGFIKGMLSGEQDLFKTELYNLFFKENESKGTTHTPQEVIDEIESYALDFKSINQTTHKLIEFINKFSLSSKIIDTEEYNRRQLNGEYWVPLRGWDGEMYSVYGQASGTQKANIRANGRKTVASDPMPYIYAMIETTVDDGVYSSAKRVLKDYLMRNIDILKETDETVTYMYRFYPNEIGRKAMKSKRSKRTFVEDGNTGFVLTDKKPRASWIDNEKSIIHGNTSEITDAEGNNYEHTETGKVEVVAVNSDYDKLNNGLVFKVFGDDKRYERLHNETLQPYIWTFRDNDGTIFRIALPDKSLVKTLNTPRLKFNEAFASPVLRNVAMNIKNLQSKMVTSYSLRFAINNVFKDLPMAMAKEVSNTKGYSGHLLKELTNIGRVAQYIFNPRGIDTNKMSAKDKEVYLSWIEWQTLGGMAGVSSFYNKDVDNVMKRLASDMGKTKWAKVKKVVGLKYVSECAELGENLIRFASYRAFIKSGLNKSEAAFQSKEVTLNYSRQGKVSQKMNLLYTFYSATMNACYKLTRLLINNPKGYFKFFMFFAMAGIGKAVISSLSGDDKDKSKYTSPYKQLRHLYVPFADGFYIPFPHEAALPFALGQDLTKCLIFDEINGDKVLYDMTQIIPEHLAQPYDGILKDMFKYNQTTDNIEFSVLSKDYRNRAVSTLSPSAVTPFVDVLALNEDFMGNNIIYDNWYGQDKTRAGRSPKYDKTYIVSELLAEGYNKILNWDLMGKNKVDYLDEISDKKGTVISNNGDRNKLHTLAPEDIQYIFQQNVPYFTGLAGKAVDGGNVLIKAILGDDAGYKGRDGKGQTLQQAKEEAQKNSKVKLPLYDEPIITRAYSTINKEVKRLEEKYGDIKENKLSEVSKQALEKNSEYRAYKTIKSKAKKIRKEAQKIDGEIENIQQSNDNDKKQKVLKLQHKKNHLWDDWIEENDLKVLKLLPK